MQLEIRLFATLKDRAGQGRVLLTLAKPEVTVREMLDALAAAYPALSPSLPTTLVAVNRQYATPETTIQAGDEVALFPPVSGGSPEESEQLPVISEQSQHSALNTFLFPPTSPLPKKSPT